MEVKNRFELLASLLIDEDEEPKESSIATTSKTSKPKQVIHDEQQQKKQWEVPEYVEKPIPCAPILTTKAATSLPVRKIKTSSSIKGVKSLADSTIYEEQQGEVQTSVPVKVQNQSITCSYYPPQPYKFNQKLLNHRDQTMPKFDRKMNVLPKHSSSRGNSKACTHQI